MSYWQKRPEPPKVEDFIKMNKPGIAIINCQQGSQPCQLISGIVKIENMNYKVICIDVCTSTQADIQMKLDTRDCFTLGVKNIQPKMIVILNVEKIKPDSSLHNYLKDVVIEKYTNQFIFLVVDNVFTDWNKWIGYLDKLTNVPHFKLNPPTQDEKTQSLKIIQPFTLGYKPESKMNIREKLNEVSKEITNFKALKTYQESVFSFGELFEFDKEQRDECKVFDGITYLRNKCRIRSSSDWTHVENVVKQHSGGSGGGTIFSKDIVRTLVNNNAPEINMGHKMLTNAMRAKWYNSFSELDCLGYEGSKMIPVTIGLTSWSEKFKVFKCELGEDVIEEDNNSVPWRKTVLKSEFDYGGFAQDQNLLTCNQYFANQFTHFEIFDSMTLMQNVGFLFDYICKVICDQDEIRILIKRLMKQFGIVMDITSRQPSIHQPDIVTKAIELKKEQQKKEEEENQKELLLAKVVKKRRPKKINNKDDDDDDMNVKKRRRKKKINMSDDEPENKDE